MPSAVIAPVDSVLVDQQVRDLTAAAVANCAIDRKILTRHGAVVVAGHF